MITPFSHYYDVDFKEMPIDTTGNYFGITKTMLNDFKEINEENKNFRYSSCLKIKLFQLAPSELKPFISFNLESVDNKLDWLRNLNGLINNINQFDQELFNHQNRLPLLNLISELISSFIKTKGLDSVSRATSEFKKIKLDINVDHFAAIIRVLIDEGVFTEFVNKEEIYRSFSSVFVKKDGTPFSKSNFKNSYLEKGSKHFDDAHGTFLRCCQLANQLKK